MKLIIHDGKTKEIEKRLKFDKNDVIFIGEDEGIHHCIGCFGCWIKSPGACVIRDHYGDMGKLISECDELIIISQCSSWAWSA